MDMRKFNLKGFKGQYLENWDPNIEVRLNCADIHLKNGEMRARTATHERYIEKLKEDNDAAELLKLKEILVERRGELISALSSVYWAIDYLNEAVTKLLEQQAYSQGYDNAVDDLTPTEGALADE